MEFGGVTPCRTEESEGASGAPYCREGRGAVSIITSDGREWNPPSPPRLEGKKGRGTRTKGEKGVHGNGKGGKRMKRKGKQTLGRRILRVKKGTIAERVTTVNMEKPNRLKMWLGLAIPVKVKKQQCFSEQAV